MQSPSNPVSEKEPAVSPQSLSYFRSWAVVFDAMFFGGPGLMLALRWSRPQWVWQSTDTALLPMVLIQAALYVPCMLWPRRSRRGWLMHFGLGLGLWFAEWRLEPMFAWCFLA
jgi:hypothetical protein